MARIENHYNILMLVIEEGDIPVSDTAAASIPASVFYEYRNLVARADNLLIPCLRVDSDVMTSGVTFNTLSTYFVNGITAGILRFKNNDDNIFTVSADAEPA